MMSRTKAKLLSFLRKYRLICKTKKRPYKPVLRIAKTIQPEGDHTIIGTQIHIYLTNKKIAAEKLGKNCKFDIENRSCVCGFTMEEFGEKGCCLKKK